MPSSTQTPQKGSKRKRSSNNSSSGKKDKTKSEQKGSSSSSSNRKKPRTASKKIPAQDLSSFLPVQQTTQPPPQQSAAAAAAANNNQQESNLFNSDSLSDDVFYASHTQLAPLESTQPGSCSQPILLSDSATPSDGDESRGEHGDNKRIKPNDNNAQLRELLASDQPISLLQSQPANQLQRPEAVDSNAFVDDLTTKQTATTTTQEMSDVDINARLDIVNDFFKPGDPAYSAPIPASAQEMGRFGEPLANTNELHYYCHHQQEQQATTFVDEQLNFNGHISSSHAQQLFSDFAAFCSQTNMTNEQAEIVDNNNHTNNHFNYDVNADATIYSFASGGGLFSSSTPRLAESPSLEYLVNTNSNSASVEFLTQLPMHNCTPTTKTHEQQKRPASKQSEPRPSKRAKTSETFTATAVAPAVVAAVKREPYATKLEKQPPSDNRSSRVMINPKYMSFVRDNNSSDGNYPVGGLISNEVNPLHTSMLLPMADVTPNVDASSHHLWQPAYQFFMDEQPRTAAAEAESTSGSDSSLTPLLGFFAQQDHFRPAAAAKRVKTQDAATNTSSSLTNSPEKSFASFLKNNFIR